MAKKPYYKYAVEKTTDKDNLYRFPTKRAAIDYAQLVVSRNDIGASIIRIKHSQTTYKRCFTSKVIMRYWRDAMGLQYIEY